MLKQGWITDLAKVTALSEGPGLLVGQNKQDCNSPCWLLIFAYAAITLP